MAHSIDVHKVVLPLVLCPFLTPEPHARQGQTQCPRRSTSQKRRDWSDSISIDRSIITSRLWVNGEMGQLTVTVTVYVYTLYTVIIISIQQYMHGGCRK